MAVIERTVGSQEHAAARGSLSSTGDATQRAQTAAPPTIGLERVPARGDFADASAVWPVTQPNRLWGPRARRTSEPRSEQLFDGPGLGRRWAVARGDCWSRELASSVDDPHRCGARPPPKKGGRCPFKVFRAVTRGYGARSTPGLYRRVRIVAWSYYDFQAR